MGRIGRVKGLNTLIKHTRVHEIAEELGMTDAEVINLSHKLGIDVKGPSSSVINAQADRIRTRAERDGLVRDEPPSDFAIRTVSMVKPNCVRLQDLAVELGLSNAELITKSFSLGFNVITADVSNYEFSEVEAGVLRELIKANANAAPSKEDNKKQKKKKKFRIIKNVDEFTTPEILADYLKRDVLDLIIFCNSYGFNIKNAQQNLTAKQVDLLYEKLEITENLLAKNSGDPLQSTIGDLLRNANEAPLRVPKVQTKSSRGKEKNKRISVLAKELKVQELTLRWLIDAVRVPVIEGKQQKFEVRHESLIKTACDIWAELPESKNMVDRMRLTKIAKRVGASTSDLCDMCDEFLISIQNKTFVSASDGVFLQTLYVCKEGKDLIHRDLDVSPEPSVSNVAIRVQYRNANYVRQDFANVSFKNSDFLQVNFSYSDISGADFSYCAMTELKMIRVTAMNTNFEEAIVKNCSFEFADLTGASFFNAKFEDVNFRKAIFSNTKWTDGRVVNSELEI